MEDGNGLVAVESDGQQYDLAYLRKASVAVYLAAEGGPADDLSAVMRWAVGEIERLSRPSYPVIRLRREVGHVLVEVEVGKEFVEVIREWHDSPFCHIVEPRGIEAKIAGAHAVTA